MGLREFVSPSALRVLGRTIEVPNMVGVVVLLTRGRRHAVVVAEKVGAGKVVEEVVAGKEAG